MSECKRCGRAARDEAYGCDDCGDKLARALGDIPWVEQEAQTTLVGSKGIDYRRGGSPATETPMPLNTAASEYLTDLRAGLVWWVLFCHEEGVRHQSLNADLPADSIPAMSRWLLWRVDGLMLHDLAGQAVDEIVGLVGRGSRLVDRAADKWYAGPCPKCGAGLFATVDAAVAKCRAPIRDVAAESEVCGHQVDIADRRSKLLDEAEDRLLSARDLSRAVSWLGAAPLTAERVRKWAERGRIPAKGHDGRSPLYRVGDAIDLLAGDVRGRITDTPGLDGTA